MNFNQFGYSKERRQFGRQCMFTDHNELLVGIPQHADLRRQYIRRNPVDCGTQLSVQKGSSTVLTENVKLASRGIQHLEGGWPKDVNILDEEQTLRHRKEIEREDTWPTQVSELCKITTESVLQNSAVNIYEDFFSNTEEMEIKSTFTSRPINVYHDPIIPYRPIVQLDWSPSHKQNILSVHSNLEYYPTTDEPNDFYIWDIENPLKTVSTFSGPTWIRKACFCPRDGTLIAGGLSDGKVCLWDVRTGGKPVGSCPLEAAHREAVSAICWVHSKSNTEFYTGSKDGSISYWDGRNLKNWYKQFLLDPERTDDQSRSRAHGCTALEFEYTIPIRYVIGDDMGHVFIGNRNGTTPMETLVLNYKLFSGPIRSIERNPFFVKNFLVVGDWFAKVWSEECKNFPSTWWFSTNVQFMCGTWSTSRCSVFATGDCKGTIDFWDLLLNHHAPIFSLNLKHAVTSIRFRKDGKLLAVSLSNGDFYMLALDKALCQSGPKEKAILASIFERETYRSKLLQDRMEEINLITAAADKENKRDEEKDDLEGDTIAEDEPDVRITKSNQQELEEIDEEESVEIDPDPEFTKIKNMFLQTANEMKEKFKNKGFINGQTPFDTGEFDFKSYSNSILENVSVAGDEASTE